jgi:DNA uptake protein ComE-like DNA-binding protein
MPILFAPDGQGVQVHNMQVNSFLQQGYRTADPTEVNPPAPRKTAPAETNAELVKVNSASLRELSEKLGLTTQQSKELRDGRLRDGRPYTSVEDLIAKIPSIVWTTFENISYEV